MTTATEISYKLNRFSQKLMPAVDNAIFSIGEQAKRSLQLKFPNLDIQGEFSPEEHQYTLIVKSAGRQMDWIWCPKWHRYFKRKADQTTNKQEMRSNVPDIAEEINRTLEMLSTELVPRIKQEIEILY